MRRSPSRDEGQGRGAVSGSGAACGAVAACSSADPRVLESRSGRRARPVPANAPADDRLPPGRYADSRNADGRYADSRYADGRLGYVRANLSQWEVRLPQRGAAMGHT